MKILVMMDLVPGTTPDKLVPYLKEEAARAWELHKQGIFRDMNFRTDRPGVVNIVECASVEEAKKILATLPLAKAGFMTFQIIPLGYPSFLENLFAVDKK
jgi:muconolactone delta-isomerase